MTTGELVDAYTETKNTLRDVGITDTFFLDLVASRLLVERIGESNNLGWWESRALSDTGRARLEEVTPKTQLKSQINLALKVGRKAESDRLPDDSISLFSFGPQMESRLNTTIEELDLAETVTFEALEDLSIQSLSDGWTDAIILETASNISTPSALDPPPDSQAGESIRIGEDGYTQDEIEPEKWTLLTTLLRGYGSCTDNLRVPYYRLNSELTSESR